MVVFWCLQHTRLLASFWKLYVELKVFSKGFGKCCRRFAVLPYYYKSFCSLHPFPPPSPPSSFRLDFLRKSNILQNASATSTTSVSYLVEYDVKKSHWDYWEKIKLCFDLNDSNIKYMSFNFYAYKCATCVYSFEILLNIPICTWKQCLTANKRFSVLVI